MSGLIHHFLTYASLPYLHSLPFPPTYLLYSLSSPPLPQLLKPPPVRLVTANQHTLWVEWDRVQWDADGTRLHARTTPVTYYLYVRIGYQGLLVGDRWVGGWVGNERGVCMQSGWVSEKDKYGKKNKNKWLGVRPERVCTCMCVDASSICLVSYLQSYHYIPSLLPASIPYPAPPPLPLHPSPPSPQL